MARNEVPVEKRFPVLVQITRASHFAWRQAVVDLCPGCDPVAVVNRMWEITGHDTAAAYVKRLDPKKPLAMQFARSIEWSSQCMGEDAESLPGAKEGEALLKACWPRIAPAATSGSRRRSTTSTPSSARSCASRRPNPCRKAGAAACVGSGSSPEPLSGLSAPSRPLLTPAAWPRRMPPSPDAGKGCCRVATLYPCCRQSPGGPPAARGEPQERGLRGDDGEQRPGRAAQGRDLASGPDPLRDDAARAGRVRFREGAQGEAGMGDHPVPLPLRGAFRRAQGPGPGTGRRRLPRQAGLREGAGRPPPPHPPAEEAREPRGTRHEDQVQRLARRHRPRRPHPDRRPEQEDRRAAPHARERPGRHLFPGRRGGRRRGRQAPRRWRRSTGCSPGPKASSTSTSGPSAAPAPSISPRRKS